MDGEDDVAPLRHSRRVGIPNREVGGDMGESAQPAPEHGPLTAYDFRDELQGIFGWTDDELRQLRIVYGAELAAGEVYLDLDHPEQGEFRATAEATVNPGCRYVPKRAVPEDLWYRVATSIGQGEIPHGAAAATPGAFGEANAEKIAASRGGSGSRSLGEEAFEMEEEQSRSHGGKGGSSPFKHKA